jgi:two-component system response regulator CpxR
MNHLNSGIQAYQYTHTHFKHNPISSKSVLIVGGDSESQQITENLLKSEGFNVTTCNDGIKALQKANKVQYQLILIDIVIPNLNGLELLKNLRLNNETPVMILSSYYDIFDKIYALERGADDYLIKPVNRRELLARMNAINRRTGKANNLLLDESLNINGFSLCVSTREVNCYGGSLELTGYEFEVLHLLILNAGKIVSKDRIGEYIHGRTVAYNDRSIDMHISNIRKKISAFSEVQKIKTVRGAGYIFLKEMI